MNVLWIRTGIALKQQVAQQSSGSALKPHWITGKCRIALISAQLLLCSCTETAPDRHKTLYSTQMSAENAIRCYEVVLDQHWNCTGWIETIKRAYHSPPKLHRASRTCLKWSMMLCNSTGTALDRSETLNSSKIRSETALKLHLVTGQDPEVPWNCSETALWASIGRGKVIHTKRNPTTKRNKIKDKRIEVKKRRAVESNDSQMAT